MAEDTNTNNGPIISTYNDPKSSYTVAVAIESKCVAVGNKNGTLVRRGSVDPRSVTTGTVAHLRVAPNTHVDDPSKAANYWLYTSICVGNCNNTGSGKASNDGNTSTPTNSSTNPRVPWSYIAHGKVGPYTNTTRPTVNGKREYTVALHGRIETVNGSGYRVVTSPPKETTLPTSA